MKRCLPAIFLLTAAAGLAWAEGDAAPAAKPVADSASAPAEDGRWVKTAVWNGSGTRQMGLFRVSASEWAIRHSHTGNGLFQLVIYDEKGALLGVPVNMDKPLPGRVRAGGSGARYFSVTADGDWTLAVEQKLTAVEEWNLVQAGRREALTKLLQKRAELSGGAGTVTRDYKLPAGRWKLVCTNLNGGRVEIQARDGGRDRVVLSAVSGRKESLEGWMYGEGTLSVVLRADAEASWKIEIFGETDKPANAPVPPGASTGKDARPAAAPKPPPAPKAGG